MTTDCPHNDTDGCQCLDCGQDIAEEMAARAEWLADMAKDNDN